MHVPAADARFGDHHEGRAGASGRLGCTMTRQQRVVAPLPAQAPVAGGPPPRTDPPTVPADMAGLDTEPAHAGDRLTSLHSLPEGTRLLDYEIVGLVGEGSFGIVYLAYDATLERHVAIKEYLPAALASRASSQAVMVKSQRHADAFGTGLRSFINEARLLARFHHPSLVKVLRFWEGNGTAYMVMPFYEGPTLAHHLQLMGRPPTEEEWLGWLQPLLHALSTLHAVRCYHRDIAPDNILLTPAGPLLLDFGAARRVVGQAAGSPTVVIKPGYAPIEQYGEAPAFKQGPWTDLYALAGVVYAAIIGTPPAPAIERWIDDRHRPLSRDTQAGYSAHFLEAIDAALALRPADRPASAAAFWKRLNGPHASHTSWSEVAPQRAFATSVALDADTETHEAQDQDTDTDMTVEIGPDTAPMPLEAPPTAAVAETAPPVAAPEPDGVPVAALSARDVQAPAMAAETPQPARQQRWPHALAFLLLLAVGVWTFDLWCSAPAPVALPTALPPPREAPTVAVAAPAAVPAPKSAPVQPPTAAAASAPAPKPRLPLPATAPGPSPVPVSPPASAPKPAPAPAPVALLPREPAPLRPVREPARPQAAETAESTRRCAELLQRASLETLRAQELSFLTRECRQ